MSEKRWLPARLQAAIDGVRQWLVGLFVSAISHVTKGEDRAAAIHWLSDSREIVASDLAPVEKLRRLNNLVNSRAVIRTTATRIAEAATNYRSSNLPLSMKVAIPATLAAIPFIGGQAAGIAAFGGALGVPVLLLVFLGVSGITSIIETLMRGGQGATQVADIIDIIIADERLRRASAEMKAAMREQPLSPERQNVPAEELALRQHLLDMDPYLFERHVMSFFQKDGLHATVTGKSNDFGVDGFVVHDEGLIVVQCKRNATENKVGRPVVQQFKGVVEEQGAFRGYIVTTSNFTQEALASAAITDKIVLVDIDRLTDWHATQPIF